VRVAAASSADTPQVWQCDQSPACYRTHLQGSACPLYKGPGQPSTHHTLRGGGGGGARRRARGAGAI
jgi:hypothetical protein